MSLLARESPLHGKRGFYPGPGCVYPGKAGAQNVTGKGKGDSQNSVPEPLNHEHDIPIQALCGSEPEAACEKVRQLRG